jgi:hypothetical protein
MNNLSNFAWEKEILVEQESQHFTYERDITKVFCIHKREQGQDDLHSSATLAAVPCAILQDMAFWLPGIAKHGIPTANVGVEICVRHIVYGAMVLQCGICCVPRIKHMHVWFIG